MESAETFGDLSFETPISTYPSTEVTENVFDFRLGTPYTNSRHCRLAFLQHLGYSPRLRQRSNAGQHLDDWLIYSPSHDHWLRVTVLVLNLYHTMGLLIHDKKSEMIPKQKFIFLWYQFDLVSFQVTPTLDRYHKSNTDLLIPAKPKGMCSSVVTW